MPAKSPKSFFSYSRADKDQLKHLISVMCQQFPSLEGAYWYDEHIEAGRDFRVEIRRQIQEADIFVVLYTPSSVISSEVQGEVELAIRHNKHIIPILWEISALPDYFPRARQPHAIAMGWGNILEETKHLGQILVGEIPVSNKKEEFHNLYVTSYENKAGRTTWISGILSVLPGSTGYYKPFSYTPEKSLEHVLLTDPAVDVRFIEQQFNHDAPDPVIISPFGSKKTILEEVYHAFGRINPYYVPILIEGAIAVSDDSAFIDMLKKFEARLVIIATPNDQNLANNLINARRMAKDVPIGVVLNKVTQDDAWLDNYTRFLKEHDLTDLGIIRFTQELQSIPLRELRSSPINGKFLWPTEEAANEDVLNRPIWDRGIGAFEDSDVIKHFTKHGHRNQAVIVGGNRGGDLIVDLLKLDIGALILTGDFRERDFILRQAESNKVPLIHCQENTIKISDYLQKLIEQSAFAHKYKIPTIRDLIKANSEKWKPFIERQ